MIRRFFHGSRTFAARARLTMLSVVGFLLWATCSNQAIRAKYGVNDASFFVPADPNPRIGVDRPGDWVPPTLGAGCDTSG